MKVFGKMIEIATPLALLASSAAWAGPAEPLQIKRITYNGSGCPLGTVAESLAADQSAFTLTFSDFFAELHAHSRLSEQTKNCLLTLTLDVPAGWQFSIADFYYRGFMDLDPGVNASQMTSYAFQGQSQQLNVRTDQPGGHAGFEGIYSHHDAIGLASTVWSQCNVERALNINTRIRLENSQKSSHPLAQGYIANDSIDGQIVQKFGITWRRCR